MRRHLPVIHDMVVSLPSAMEWRENFTPMTAPKYEHERIVITNRRDGRTARSRRLLLEVEIPDMASIATGRRAPPSNPQMPPSPTVRRLAGHSSSAVTTTSQHCRTNRHCSDVIRHPMESTGIRCADGCASTTRVARWRRLSTTAYLEMSPELQNLCRRRRVDYRKRIGNLAIS